MKARRILPVLIAGIIPAALTVLNAADFIMVIQKQERYYFVSEYSFITFIFTSQLHSIQCFINLSLLITIILAFRAKWKAFFIFLSSAFCYAGARNYRFMNNVPATCALID